MPPKLLAVPRRHAPLRRCGSTLVEQLVIMSVVGVLAAAGVTGAARLLDAAWVHITARDMVVDVDYPGFGPLRTFGSPVKLDRTPARTRGTAPAIGAHTTGLLTGLLGYSAEEIDGLRADGTVI